MTKINKIYKGAYKGCPAAWESDDRLNEQVKGELISKIKEPAAMSKEEITDLIYAGSSRGQAAGFESGFQFAVALIMESLVG